MGSTRGTLSWPSLLFTQSSLLAHSARQTPRHASRKVLHSSSSLPSSVTSLKLCDFLFLFLSPNSIFGENIVYSKSCSRKSLLRKTKSLTRIHSAESLSVCLINQLNFSSGCATDAVIGSILHCFAVIVLIKCYLRCGPLPA